MADVEERAVGAAAMEAEEADWEAVT